MHPILLQLGDLTLRSYAAMVVLGALVAWRVRRAEVARLNLDAQPGHRFIALGALVGAVVGAKLGMLLFEPAAPLPELLRRALRLDFAGKTVIGGIAGGYLGVELTKRLVGVTRSTGDGFAVALPLAQAVGRLGCLLEGCCWGVPSPQGLPSVHLHGADRVPVQLLEALALLGLAGWLWHIRERPRPEGHLFRRYLVGYALIRFVAQFLRGDPVRMLGPLDAAQWVCLAAAAVFAWLIWRGERGQPAAAPLTPGG